MEVEKSIRPNKKKNKILSKFWNSPEGDYLAQWAFLNQPQAL